MTELTTWNNNPRELWVENTEGNFIKKFIVFYDITEGYGLDKQGNRYDVVYEPTDLKDCVTYDEFRGELIHSFDNKKIDIDVILNMIGEWLNKSFLPNYDKQLKSKILSPICAELRRLRNDYDLSDVTRNRFRFSPNEQFLAEEFYQKISSLLNSILE